MLFRLISLTVCCPLFGQQVVAPSSKKATTPRDTTFFYSRDTVLWPAPVIKNLKPAGDVRLRRFGDTPLALDRVGTGDTLDLLLVSKSATPFKKVLWVGKTHEQKAVFRYRDTMPQAFSTELKIKPGCSLKRRVATLTLRSIGQRLPIHAVDTKEIQVRNNPYGQQDTMVRFFRAQAGQPKILMDTAYSVTTLDSGRTIRRRGEQLMLKTRAYKPDTLLPKGTFNVPRFGKKVIRYDGFEKGDTVFFDVKVAGKTPLRSIVLKNHQNQRINSATDAMAFADTLVATDKSYVDLQLTGTPAWKKQQVSIKVWRVRPSVVDSFHVVHDTLYSIKDTILYDILALTVKDDSLQLAPVLDIYNKPAGHIGRMEIQVPAKIPDKDTAYLSAVAYWIGVGLPCLADYQTVEKTVPPDWGLPGAPAALGAYGNGHPLLLPHLNTRDVAMAFNQSGKPIAPNTTASLLGLSLLQNARIVPAKQLKAELKIDATSGLYRFFACFNNKSTDMAYPVQVKMVAYYRKEKSRHREVKKMGTTTVIKKLSAT